MSEVVATALRLLRFVVGLVLFLPGTLGLMVGQIVSPWWWGDLEPLARLDGERHPGHPNLRDYALGTTMLVLSPILLVVSVVLIVWMAVA